MNKQREAGKHIAIERLKADSDAALKDLAARISVQAWPYSLKETKIACAVAIEFQRLMAATQTPARVFRPDGKINKRRWRRFVTRHKKPVFLLRPTTDH